MKYDLKDLQSKLGHSFSNMELLHEALVHPSYRHERKSLTRDNQRLEFLGDTVLQFLLTTELYEKFPDAPEGKLTQARSALAREESLVVCACEIGLDKKLMLGRSEKKNPTEAVIADAFEAVLGALFLDAGLEKVSQFYLPLMNRLWPDPMKTRESFNPKGALQEFVQIKGGPVPVYKTVSRIGEEHAPIFTVSCLINKKFICEGEGSSLRRAQEDAARKALEALQSRSQAQQDNNFKGKDK